MKSRVRVLVRAALDGDKRRADALLPLRARERRRP